MSLLELQRVSKRYTRGELDAADARRRIAVASTRANWSPSGGCAAPGARRCCASPRGSTPPTPAPSASTAATSPSHGDRHPRPRDRLLPEAASASAAGQPAIEEVMLGLLVNGVAAVRRARRAHEALERVGARLPAAHGASPSSTATSASGSRSPTRSRSNRGCCVIDEPVAGVELHQRDEILLLLRSLADEGLAVLMSVGELTGLSGADQSFTLGDGELRGSAERAELAPVVTSSARRRACG